ncbi:hypothetical protein NDN08_007282 [Rhodosorus marinus]|uniref:Uncharacterized protein n=1 Tax=Rhodosorus marinus TaxID=101924 RepID=A0AAV8ULC9_9RHOD|nr:hypothetical protein NDN08_007282 [Rhodosorus marinus]
MERVRSSLGGFEEWIHRKVLTGLLRRRAPRYAAYPFLLFVLDLLYMISITTVAIVLQSAYVGFYVTMVCIRAIDLTTLLIYNMPWGLLSIVQLILASAVLGLTLHEVFVAVDGSAEKRDVVVGFVLIAIAVCLELFVLFVVLSKQWSGMLEVQNQMASFRDLRDLANIVASSSEEEQTEEEAAAWKETVFYLAVGPEETDVNLGVPTDSAVLKRFNNSTISAIPTSAADVEEPLSNQV